MRKKSLMTEKEESSKPILKPIIPARIIDGKKLKEMMEKKKAILE
jgi:hypothetical protein